MAKGSLALPVMNGQYLAYDPETVKYRDKVTGQDREFTSNNVRMLVGKSTFYVVRMPDGWTPPADATTGQAVDFEVAGLEIDGGVVRCRASDIQFWPNGKKEGKA
jgi:hypothetical protein